MALHGTAAQQNNQKYYENLKTDGVCQPDPIKSTLTTGPHTGCYKLVINGGMLYELDKNTNVQLPACVDENGANNFVPSKVIVAITANLPSQGLLTFDPCFVYLDTPDVENAHVLFFPGIEHRIQVTRVRLTGTDATEIQLWY